MESHRLDTSPDVRRSPRQQQVPRGGQDSVFGVRVQVQGIKGQPYVVLNSPGQDSPRDISVITHQAGYNPGMVRRSMDERQATPETQRTTSSPVFHYQNHPEILRPYDPKSNNLNFVFPSQLASVGRPGEVHTNIVPEANHTANGTKPRVPLPAESPREELDEPPSSGGPARSPNSVDADSILSVGKLISQFNSSLRRGRGGPRNKLDPEQCRRSRSVDSRRISDSSSSSSSSCRTSSLKGIRVETPGGMYPPGSARARLLGGEATLTNKRDESKTSAPPQRHNGREVFSPQGTKLLPQGGNTSISRSCNEEPDDRDSPVMSLIHSTVVI